MTRRDDFLRAAEKCDRAAKRGWIDDDVATLLREAAEMAEAREGDVDVVAREIEPHCFHRMDEQWFSGGDIAKLGLQAKRQRQNDLRRIGVARRLARKAIVAARAAMKEGK